MYGKLSRFGHDWVMSDRCGRHSILGWVKQNLVIREINVGSASVYH